jgi:hypothetical protein
MDSSSTLKKLSDSLSALNNLVPPDPPHRVSADPAKMDTDRNHRLFKLGRNVAPNVDRDLADIGMVCFFIFQMLPCNFTTGSQVQFWKESGFN